MMAADTQSVPDCPADRYRLVTVAGRDAGTFLQGQLTRDVLDLGASEAGLTALLTPQGRVIAVAWLLHADDGYALAVPAALALPVRDRLQRYVLRAKVALALAEAGVAQRGRLAAALAGAAGERDWPLALVRAGVPEIGVETSEEWIPQMLNLDLLGAISFTKGCYTGQEIVARTQHLGRIKRRLLRFECATTHAPAPKTALFAMEQKVGEVVLATAASRDVELLAVVNLDARDEALALPDGNACRLAPLPYHVT